MRASMDREYVQAEEKGALDVSVVLPTYNEAGNIEQIVREIVRVLAREGLKGEILVVDDNSPDGTAGIAEGLSREYPVHVHVRMDARGLATAVMKGFELSRGRVCVVMDADLSHPVDKLGEMVRPVLAGECDATVGSRYGAEGGSHGWPIVRKIVSRGSGLLARGLTRLSDPTSGFMAVRRSLIDAARLDPVGWKIVLETIVKLQPRLQEVPIVFSDRRTGVSKLDGRVTVDYLRHLWRLYCYRYRGVVEFLKFCLVGASGLAVDTLGLVLLVELMQLDPRFAAVFAFGLAVSWNYTLNRAWTFGARSSRLYSYLTFIAICCIGLGIRIGVMHVLLAYAGMAKGHRYVLASIAGIAAATLFNFSGAKYISFARPPRDREPLIPS